MIAEITYDHGRRSKFTFRCRAMREFVERFFWPQLDPDNPKDNGVWLDPFLGQSIFPVEHKNDINESGIDSHDWIKGIETSSVDGVLFDPPYSLTQCARAYKIAGIRDWQSRFQMRSGCWPRLKDDIARVCKSGAQVLSFGWDSNGMGSGRGFRKTHIKLICHSGGSRDTICVREVKK